MTGQVLQRNQAQESAQSHQLAVGHAQVSAFGEL